MSTEIRLPSLGVGMTEGKLVEWLANDGDAVSAGDQIYALENEKSVQEIESPATGVLRIAAEIDEVYPVGAVIGHIE